jgi:hypothetical protein
MSSNAICNEREEDAAIEKKRRRNSEYQSTFRNKMSPAERQLIDKNKRTKKKAKQEEEARQRPKSYPRRNPIASIMESRNNRQLLVTIFHGTKEILKFGETVGQNINTAKIDYFLNALLITKTDNCQGIYIQVSGGCVVLLVLFETWKEKK